jgi:hypothetical protein
MHYNVLIILRRPPEDLRSHVKAVLAPFYVENDDRIRSRWDGFTINDGPFTDAVAISSFGHLAESEKTCVCRIAHIPPEYSAAAVLTPEGVWHDIEDFGWRLIDQDSKRNMRATEAWDRHFREAIAGYPDSFGVEVHCHG